MAKRKEVNTNLLKRLVEEFDLTVTGAISKFKEDKDIENYAVELSKAIGLCSSISQESNMLMHDIMHAMQNVSVVEVPVKPKGGFGDSN
jgi:hypothetical protein